MVIILIMTEWIYNPFIKKIQDNLNEVWKVSETCFLISWKNVLTNCQFGA